MRTLASFFGASLQALSVVSYPLTTTESAGPVPTPQLSISASDAPTYNWMSGYVHQFSIHSSCNSTERHELSEGLRQAVELAEHAKNHILVHGNTSEIYQKYFGRGPTGIPIGWFDKIASGNRAGVLFRCDDPDRNCETQHNWAGHWRGSNASTETVICPLSYEIRLPLTAMCARGFEVATGRPANYWGADLMHRLYHVPLIGEGMVEHYADGYHGVQELAAGNNYTWAGSNSATLTYFATEVYAFDIAIPGEGCVGKEIEEEDDGHAHASSSSSAAASSAGVSAAASTSAVATEATSPTVNPTRVIPVEATPTAATPAESSTGSECHTHDDGTLHCV